MPELNPQSLVAALGEPPPSLDRIEHYLAHWARHTPQAEAVVDETGRLTYAQLLDEVAASARALAGRGVREGACVAVLAPPSIDFLVTFIATISLGATWLGLNPKHTRVELERVIDDACPILLLARSRVAELDLLEKLLALRERMRGAGEVLLLDQRPDAGPLERLRPLETGTGPAFAEPTEPVALYVYTSGSTGQPKAARLSHRALIRGAVVRARVWHVSPWRSLNNLPINHIGSVGDIAVTALVAGGCQVCLERFTPEATLECLQRESVSIWYQVPTMFQMCLDAAAAIDMDWSALQAAVWSGGRASRSLTERLAAVARFLAVDYSMTESVGAITLAPLTRSLDALEDCVGWPDPTRELRLADPATLEPAEAGQAGEVQIRDNWMFDGYRGSDQPPEAYTPDGWFRTGDIAQPREDGAWRLVGRSKEMFKSGGYNVYPREVEMVLETQAQVAAVAIVAVEDPLYGEVGVAFIVPRGAGLDLAALDAHCRSRLANYKVPKCFLPITALPMLPIGKVDKVALRRQAQAGS